MNNDQPDKKELMEFVKDHIDASLLAKIKSLAGPAKLPPANSRWQDRIILNELPEGSSVLDLGCGEGELLSRLISSLKVKGQGVELDPRAVVKSIERGVPVLNLDLDQGLGYFKDQSFDFVILESTLQTLKEPIKVLLEMLRIGRRGIVSFPNFGHWRVRFDLSVKGRMPVTDDLPYTWHDTPNIHLFTLGDFLDWCADNKVRVTEAFGLVNGQVGKIAEADSLTIEEALLFLEAEER